MRRVVLALGLSLFAVTSWAQTPAALAAGSLTFDPSSTVTAGGGKFFVNGTCDADSSGFVISEAFAAQPGGTEFAGVPALAITTGADGGFGIGLTIDPSVSAGTYDVTLRCGGGLAASAKLTVINPTSIPRTGAPVDRLLGGAVVVLATGLAMSVGSRRRRQPQSAGR